MISAAHGRMLPILRRMKMGVDTRAYVAVLANEMAQTYADLKAAGIENEFSLKRIFRHLEKIAQTKPDKEAMLLTEPEDAG